MNMQRWMMRSIPFAAAALVGAAPAAFAQGQEMFEWSGRVDRQVMISMRNNQISTRDIGNNEFTRARTRVFNAVPRQDGQVSVRVLDGRGNVDVIQQPTSQNGYTTVIRITDRSGGADNYHIAAYWEGYANGDYIGRGRGRGRDDRDDRGNRGRDVYGNNGGYQNQSMLRWSGNVDDELEIRIQNGRVDYRTLRGSQPTSIRANVGNMSMPRNGAQIFVTNAQGRGSVNVIQQPSAYNSYTTVIRVKDPQGGYGYYSFDLMWQ